VEFLVRLGPVQAGSCAALPCVAVSCVAAPCAGEQIFIFNIVFICVLFVFLLAHSRCVRYIDRASHRPPIKDSAMLTFIKGLPAQKAHLHLKKADQAMEMARQNAILWFGEIHGRKLYCDLGYSSMVLYAQQELGWSQSKAYDFLKIGEKLDELPLVKKKVEEGKLGYARTRTIVGVASPENEKEWVDLALNKSHTQLKEAAQKARRKAAEVAKGQVAIFPEEPVPAAVVPQRVTLEMTPTQLARYEALWEKLRKQGGLPADKVEALLALMQSGISNPLEKPAGPPVQIHVHQCPDCEKPRCKPRAASSRCRPRRPSASSAMRRSVSQATATRPPFPRKPGARSWPATATSARLPAAPTPISWKSTTSFPAPGAGPTIPII
jgi:hypothetical protein